MGVEFSHPEKMPLHEMVRQLERGELAVGFALACESDRMIDRLLRSENVGLLGVDPFAVASLSGSAITPRDIVLSPSAGDNAGNKDAANDDESPTNVDRLLAELTRFLRRSEAREVSTVKTRAIQLYTCS